MPIDPELIECLEGIGTFSVDTCGNRPDSDERTAAHVKVIRPLVLSSFGAYVWPAAKSVKPIEYPTDILIAEKGRHRFDLRKECVLGYETFWNAVCWQRGSIALRLPQIPPGMSDIFSHCTEPAVMSSRYQLAKGDSRAALRYCDECVAAGDLAFCFSASNGIQFLSIFAPVGMLVELYELSARVTRR